MSARQRALNRKRSQQNNALLLVIGGRAYPAGAGGLPQPARAGQQTAREEYSAIPVAVDFPRRMSP